MRFVHFVQIDWGKKHRLWFCSFGQFKVFLKRTNYYREYLSGDYDKSFYTTLRCSRAVYESKSRAMSKSKASCRTPVLQQSISYVGHNEL